MFAMSYYGAGILVPQQPQHGRGLVLPRHLARRGWAPPRQMMAVAVRRPAADQPSVARPTFNSRAEIVRMRRPNQPCGGTASQRPA
jgi:hypothetical protein